MLIIIVTSQPDLIQKQEYSFWRLFTNNFVYFGDKQRFFFQSKLRIRSIYFISGKDFLCSFLMVLIFQYVNYDYFTSLKYSNVEQLESKADVEAVIKGYQNKTRLAAAFVLTILLHIIQRIWFMYYHKQSQHHQVWFYTDIIVSIGILFGISFMNRMTYDDLMHSSRKSQFDYAIVCVVVITWLRFFNYFLLDKKLAKLSVTLLQIIRDTMSFVFLTVLILIIFTFAFTTRFSEVDENYQDLWHSLRYLFDVFIANYEYDYKGNYQRSYSAFLIIFLLITNVFLLNYMATIIDSIFKYME